MMLNLVLHGNAYARIERNGRGEVVALIPMAASQMEVRLLNDGTVIYAYTVDSHTAVIAAENVMHIKIWGNGLVGMSPLTYARNTIGLGLAEESYANRYFTNGGKPGGILTIDQVLKKEQRDAIKKMWKAQVEGTENAHKLLLLEAGMEYKQIQLNPEDMQMMDARRFQVEDIARFMGVPSVLINAQNTTTWGSGIEQIMLGFYNLNLRPYLERWEQALERSLLKPKDRAGFQIEFDFERLLRGDMRSRSAYYSQLVQNGLLTRNEGRSRLGLSRSDDENADTLTIQVNMSPIEDIGESDNESNQVDSAK
jgi:HK97 family phage portal protein